MHLRMMLLAAVVGSAAGSASAFEVPLRGLVDFSTENTGATYEGFLDYSHQGGSTGLLRIGLTNTTPDDVGGYLTGFAFDFFSTDDDASARLLSAGVAMFLDTGEESAPPFGTYRGGAALGANWTGGGNPSGGLGVGQSAEFEFEITALDAGDLTTLSFLRSRNEFPFVARFRGLDDGGSDKVPAIPAPGAAGLAMLGALGVVRRRR